MLIEKGLFKKLYPLRNNAILVKWCGQARNPLVFAKLGFIFLITLFNVYLVVSARKVDVNSIVLFVLSLYVLLDLKDVKQKLSKDDQLILLFIWWMGFKISACIAFIVGGLLMLNNGKVIWEVPILLGLCWFPYLEFTIFRNKIYNLLIIRWIVSIVGTFYFCLVK